MVNGRKCYELNDSVIQWDVDASGNGQWVIKGDVGTKFYSTSNVACPLLAEWKVTDTGGSASGLGFNGKTRDEIIAGRPEVNEQCCTPSQAPFKLYNANTHNCCPSGSVVNTGDIC